MKCLEIAKIMLDLKEDEYLLPTVMVRLAKIDQLIKKVKPEGELNFTQVIGYVVEEYLRGLVR